VPRLRLKMGIRQVFAFRRRLHELLVVRPLFLPELLVVRPLFLPSDFLRCLITRWK